jgi:hypothetical protein
MTLAIETWSVAWRWCSRADGVLGRRALRGEVRVQRARERTTRGSYSRIRCRSCATKAVRQRVGQRPAGAPAASRARRARRRRAARPAGEVALRQSAQVLDQRELEHARPGPELADRQRRDGLEGEDEARQASRRGGRRRAGSARRPGRGRAPCPRARAARAWAACGSSRPAGSCADAADLRLDEVEVVEEPLGRRRHELAAMDVVRRATR